MAFFYVSFVIVAAVAASVAICCIYCKVCPYYRKRRIPVNPDTTVRFVVGQNNVAYYDQHGNPIILSPNNLVLQNPNLNPPPYPYQQQRLQSQPVQHEHSPAILVLNPISTNFLAYQTDGLNAHNTYRMQHGSPLMKLDPELNKAAQDCAVYYAQNRKIDHSCKTEGAGENLYAIWGGTGNPNFSTTVKKACQEWYNEKSTYNFENPGASTGVTGHFTQLVWKESTRLGIGAATVNGYTAIVAKYKEQGNITLEGYGVDQWEYYKTNVKRSNY